MYYDMSDPKHEDKYAEVELIDEAGTSHIYWFKLDEVSDKNDDEWMIDKAKAYHLSLTGDTIPEDGEDFNDAHSFFLDMPFSRNSNEFKFVPLS